MKRLPSILLLAAMLLLPASQTSTGQSSNVRRDGNWWTGQENIVKYSYIAGLIDGVDLGAYMTVASLSKQPEKLSQSEATASVTGIMKKFANVTVGQISDGLDNFYADYRNRRIEIYFGVLVVLSGIEGMPEEELNKRIDNLRKNASNY